MRIFAKNNLINMKKSLLTMLLFAGFLSAMGTNPKVVAHRGHHRAEGSAQNSIRSLVKADSIGADFCEFDVWLSADDVLYVNHNADINGVVIETSLSEQIDTCRLKNGERIPRLDAFLDTASTLGIGLVLELKHHKDSLREDVAVPKIVELVAEKGLSPRTTYITFSKHAHGLLVEQGGGRPVFYLTGCDPDELVAMKSSGADFHISHFRKNPDWIERTHANGMEVNIWTVDKEEDIRYAIDRGADYITTNEPELTQKLIKETNR